MYKRICFTSNWMIIWCILTNFSQNTTAADQNSRLINFQSNGQSYSYETDNGIKRTENVQLKNSERPVIVFSGSYAYTDPKGVQVSVEYVADENGYAPRVKIVGLPKEFPTTPVPEYAYNIRVGYEVIESLIHNG